MDQIEQIILDIEEGPAVTKADRANRSLQAIENTAERGMNAASKNAQLQSEMVVRVVDRSRNSIERMIASVEKRAATSSGTRLEQLAAEREASVKRVAGDPEAVNRMTAAYNRLIGAQRQADNSALLDRARAASDRATASATKFEQALQRQNRAARDGIAALEKRAALAGKSAVGRLEVEQQDVLKRFGTTPDNVQRITDAFAKLKEEAGGAGLSLSSIFGKLAVTYGTLATAKVLLKDLALGSALYAARTEQLGVALEAVGRANYVSTGTLAASEQQIKKVGITTQDTREAMARLIASNIQLSKASELARVAQNLGRVANINSSEAFERLTHAIVTQQPELLRTLGLNVNLQREFEIAARKTGRSADALSEFEKRQITVNAVLNAATAYSGVYARSLDTAGGKILSFKRYLLEAKEALGKELLPELNAAVSALEGMRKGAEGLRLLQTIVAAQRDKILPLKAFDRTDDEGFRKLGQQQAIDKVNEGTAFERRKEEERLQQVEQKRLEILQKQKEAALRADERAAQFREEAVGEELGGINRILHERSKLIHESSRILLDGQRYEVQLSGKALADIDAGTQAKVREERRKTQDEVRKEQARTADLILANEKTNLSARETYANAVNDNALAREVLDRRTVENERLAIHKETLDKIAALDVQLVRDQSNREIEQIRREESRKGTDPKQIAALVTQAQQQAAEKTLQIDRQVNDAKNQADIALTTTRTERDRAYAERTRDAVVENQLQAIQAEQAGFEQSRNLQLEQLGLIQTRSLQSKLQLEQAKSAIEQDYLRRSEAAELRSLEIRHGQELTRIKQDQDRGGISEIAAGNQRLAVNERYNEDRRKISAATNAAITLDTTKASVAQAQIVIQHYQDVYDSFRSNIDKIFDDVSSKSKTVFEAIGDTIKSSILNAFKQIISSQVALQLTRIVTGAQGSIQSAGGPGALGRLGGILGIGAPVFAGGANGIPNNGIGGLGAVLGGAAAPYLLGPGGTSGFAGPVTSGGVVLGPGGFPVAIGPGGTAPFSGASYGTSGGTQSNGGFSAARLAGGFAGNGRGLLDFIFGGPERPTSFKDGLGTIGRSNAAVLGGGLLAYDGLRRGGLTGLAETTAGGALIGFKYGGPIGAAIGAGVGAIAGIVRLFVKGAIDKARTKIKSIYGIDISDKGILGQIVDMAKQGFGGNLDVAIRSPQIREMIELYAMSTGQNSKGVVDRPQASIFSNSGGQLTQVPTYYNGAPVLPGDTNSSVGTPVMINGQWRDTPVGGANATPANSAPMTVVVQMDRATTAQFVQGQQVSAIANNPRTVSASTNAGMRQSSARREGTAALLSTNTITA